MSALALYALKHGAVVSGSDMSDGKLLQNLSAAGANVYIGENPSMIDRVDAVVYSSAIREDNVELRRAVQLEKRLYERYEFLSELSKTFNICVAIAGTHGKTTVTAMLAHVFKVAGLNFVGHVGGETEYGNLIENRAFGQSIFLTEACEYKRGLIALSPHVGVVLNAECDHPDCYPDIASVKDVFSDFLNKSEIKITADESLLCKNAHMSKRTEESDEENKDGRVKIKVFSNGDTKIWSFGELERECDGFCVCLNGEKLGTIRLLQGGEYNRVNALFAVAVADVIGIPFSETATALTSFTGVKRRFEHAGKIKGAELIFDYAHHPTQLKNVLDTAKKYGKVLTVFQPHTYSRTAEYMSSFVSVLGGCESLIIMPTYAAREKSDRGADSEELYLQILSEFADNDVYLTKTHLQTAELVKSFAENYDAILCLGAGDIYDLKTLLNDAD